MEKKVTWTVEKRIDGYWQVLTPSDDGMPNSFRLIGTYRDEKEARLVAAAPALLEAAKYALQAGFLPGRQIKKLETAIALTEVK